LDYIVYSGLKMKRMMSQKFWARTHTLTRMWRDADTK
jgi:hypothetical protein